MITLPVDRVTGSSVPRASRREYAGWEGSASSHRTEPPGKTPNPQPLAAALTFSWWDLEPSHKVAVPLLHRLLVATRTGKDRLASSCHVAQVPVPAGVSEGCVKSRG